MRKSKTLARSFCLAVPLCASQVQANISSDLSSFFDSIPYNQTDPGSYQTQAAGYYTAGGLYARVPTRNYQLASVNLPSARAGCGGIDLYGGSFSFIDSSALVSMFRNIGQNALGFAFNLALSTISPKTEELVNKMQAFANNINSMNINSCESAASLVGGLWPKTDEAQKQVCQSIGTSQGIFTDWAAARQGCGSEGDRTKTLNAGKNSPQFKDLVFDKGNIAWKALKKNAWTGNDTQLAEMVMSMTGTIILNHAGGDSDPPIMSHFAPRLTEEKYTAFLRGGDIAGYRCVGGTGEEECLQLADENYTVAVADGFATKVEDRLLTIVASILNNQALGPRELGLLNATSLPVYKMLNVYTAYSPAGASDRASFYADLIATDILFNYLQQILDATLVSSDVLQIPGENLKKFQSQILAQRRFLNSEQAKVYSRAKVMTDLVNETMLIERTLISSLSSGLSGSYHWAKSLR